MCPQRRAPTVGKLPGQFTRRGNLRQKMKTQQWRKRCKHHAAAEKSFTFKSRKQTKALEEFFSKFCCRQLWYRDRPLGTSHQNLVMTEMDQLTVNLSPALLSKCMCHPSGTCKLNWSEAEESLEGRIFESCTLGPWRQVMALSYYSESLLIQTTIIRIYGNLNYMS